MRTSVLLTGFILLLVANLLMVFVGPVRPSEGFTNYFLENAAGTGSNYKPIGKFDGVALESGNNSSKWRHNSPNEALRGPAFQVGPDSLFMFKNNQCKPEHESAVYSERCVQLQ